MACFTLSRKLSKISSSHLRAATFSSTQASLRWRSWQLSGREPIGLRGIRSVSGTLLGGTLVTLRGLQMAHGADYRCRFASLTVRASYDASSGLVRCVSPSALALLGHDGCGRQALTRMIAAASPSGISRLPSSSSTGGGGGLSHGQAAASQDCEAG